MATDLVTIEVYGQTLVAKELDLIGARGGSMMGIWPAIAERMESIVKENFETRGIRGGNFWQDLTYDWLRRKFQAGDNLNIGRQSDAMYNALTGKSEDSVRDYHDDYMEFGANLLQFRVQQNYSENANFPERRPISFTLKDVREFSQIMLEWTLGTRNAAGKAIIGGSGSNRGTFRKAPF